ncbi:MAG: hypothetical protein L3K18_09625 [Thermoplasmata archaeon]|nr:hypothetical protein [Thermoplasmata archaeon]
MTLAQDLAIAEDDIRTAQIALRSAFRHLDSPEDVVPGDVVEARASIGQAQASLQAAMTNLMSLHQAADREPVP